MIQMSSSKLSLTTGQFLLFRPDQIARCRANMINIFTESATSWSASSTRSSIIVTSSPALTSSPTDILALSVSLVLSYGYDEMSTQPSAPSLMKRCALTSPIINLGSFPWKHFSSTPILLKRIRVGFILHDVEVFSYISPLLIVSVV